MRRDPRKQGKGGRYKVNGEKQIPRRPGKPGRLGMTNKEELGRKAE